jgi:hypothetical protein
MHTHTGRLMLRAHHPMLQLTLGAAHQTAWSAPHRLKRPLLRSMASSSRTCPSTALKCMPALTSPLTHDVAGASHSQPDTATPLPRPPHSLRLQCRATQPRPRSYGPGTYTNTQLHNTHNLQICNRKPATSHSCAARGAELQHEREPQASSHTAAMC